MGDRRFHSIAVLSAVAALVGLSAIGSSPASATRPDSVSGTRAVCGVVIFKKNPHGSGGVVGAHGVSCPRARKLIAKCGRNGIEPAGWHAISTPSQAKLVLTRGKARISVVYGGHPPGARRCAS